MYDFLVEMAADLEPLEHGLPQVYILIELAPSFSEGTAFKNTTKQIIQGPAVTKGL